MIVIKGAVCLKLQFIIYLELCCSPVVLPVPDSELARRFDSPQIKTAEALEHEYFEEGNGPMSAGGRCLAMRSSNALIERALRDNPTLQQARTKIEYAYQIAQTKRAKLFPS